MELKDYQLTVIQDLATYLDTLLVQCNGELNTAFSQYWFNKGVANQKYKNNITNVPHVCVKVPTAGGKTFIAVNALDTIFQAIAHNQPQKSRFVVWLVPSLTILEQTVKHLSNPEHPYRQKLNVLFNGRVQIFEKNDLLLGADFNADSVRAQLSIVVMTFDAFRTKNKEGRKVYQDNGYLASFDTGANQEALLSDYDASALINVIRLLNPVVVVDESHNAETALSVEMLQNLNPAFILDLTATPRDNSNIISYVNAIQLKKQHMVKLPVIVANQRTQEDVINAALKMRYQLECYAREEQEKGGSYIRPIVLFQAEPKGKEDSTTFEKIKQTLLGLPGISEEEIKIKTANINELKNIDLSAPDCPVRYIITINALKEGWDCPFAYILATLANKSSVVDVTQILGRVLRMPDVRRQKIEYLNMSYVFTASNQFKKTLDSVVAGLNQAGFSKNDYRQTDISELPVPAIEPIVPATPELPLIDTNIEYTPLDSSKLNQNWKEEAEQALAHDPITPEIDNTTTTTEVDNTDALTAIKEAALLQNREYELQAETTPDTGIPLELEKDVNQENMKPIWVETVQQIKLPQFFRKVETGGFFAKDEQWQQLESCHLLSGFVLATKDASFNFDDVPSEAYQVDIEEIGSAEVKASYTALAKTQKERLNKIIREQSDRTQVNSIVNRLFLLIGKNAFYPIADQDAKSYLTRIIESFTPVQRDHCLDHDWRYIDVIKKKIRRLADEHAEKEFNNWLSLKKIHLQPEFGFSPFLILPETAPSIQKSLYTEEAKINNFERKMIEAIAALDNVLWWHRNLEKGKGFVINGFINHYPDFIVMTKSKNMIIIETKGDDRDNSDSQAKLNLGETWENQANILTHETGLNYHYKMIFESNAFGKAHNFGDALSLIKQL